MPASLITSYDQLPVTLNAMQIAKVLGISKNNAYTLFHRKDFPTIRVGERYLVPRDLFIEWLNKTAIKTKPETDSADLNNS